MLQTYTAETAAPSISVNSTTKAELLDRAKVAIGDGEHSLRKAAEALALAQKDFGATQREIAQAVGKSVAWVNRLLQWEKEGCQGTPFGPGSKASRVRRMHVQATEQREASPDTGVRTRGVSTKKPQPPRSEPEKALAEFRVAVDVWFAKMNEETKREAVAYAISKRKENLS